MKIVNLRNRSTAFLISLLNFAPTKSNLEAQNMFEFLGYVKEEDAKYKKAWEEIMSSTPDRKELGEKLEILTKDSVQYSLSDTLSEWLKEMVLNIYEKIPSLKEVGLSNEEGDLDSYFMLKEDVKGMVELLDKELSNEEVPEVVEEPSEEKIAEVI